MQELKKVILSPTRLSKDLAPDAIGSLSFSDDNKQLSLNLFNMPEPALFTTGADSASYSSWFYNPDKGEVLPIGTLTSAGEKLYILYDVKVPPLDGFSEIIITAENENGPGGEILLIGYLERDSSGPLEDFEPFAPVLPNHRWWKLRRLENSTPFSALEPHMLAQLPGLTRLAEQGFDLPEIIGIMTGKDGATQYLVHGIPGRFLRTEQPSGGQTGYLHWQPYYGMEEKIGAIGYWLSYIDLKTNQIAIPLGVTIPPG